MRVECMKCGETYALRDGHECVTKPVTVTKKVTTVTEDVTQKRCPTCGRKFPMTAAERKRKSRMRNA